MRSQVILLLAAGLIAGPALAQGAESADSGTGTALGRTPRLQLDYQFGTFVGARLKGVVMRTPTCDWELEGFFGKSFLDFDAFGDHNGHSDAFGLGGRADFYLSQQGRSAWILAPAVDVYHLTSDGSSWISLNADLSYRLEFTRYFGWVIGLKGGPVIAVHDSGGSTNGYRAGDTKADIALFTGFGF